MTARFMTMVRTFRRDESGAVTVDWIVLTASVAFLAIFIVSVLSPANGGMSQRLADGINNINLTVEDSVQ